MSQAQQSQEVEALSTYLDDILHNGLISQTSAEASAARAMVAELAAVLARRATTVKHLRAALALAQPTLALDGQPLLDAIGRVYPTLTSRLEEAEAAEADCVEIGDARATVLKWKEKFSALATDALTQAATAGDLAMVQCVFSIGSMLGCEVVQQSRVQGGDNSIGMLMAFSGDMDILKVAQSTCP